MRLSIFSFKNPLVLTLLIVLGLTVLYVLIIQLSKPSISFTQNQYQANMVFAQDFVYLKDKPSHIIIGSSMATHMKFDKNADVYNLAFGGGGPLTGLEIIRRSGYIPKVIYIESNVFTMNSDNVFLESLFPLVLFEMRGHVIALQEKYQLLNLVGESLYRLAGRSQAEKLHQKVDKVLLDKLVNSALRKDHVLVLKDKESLLRTWHTNIDYFLQYQTKIVFFEMPNDPRLVQIKSRQELRALIKDEFPNIVFMLEDNVDGKYETGDGTHLTMKSAKMYSQYFKDTIMLEQ